MDVDKLSSEHNHTENIAATLTQRAALQPQRHAVIFPHARDRHGRISYTHLTYAQLDHASDRAAAALKRQGLKPGQRTVLMLPPGLDFFTLTFALFKLGAVPVLIDPGMGVKNLGTCLDQVEPQAFIGNLKANVARLVLGWSKQSLKLSISTASLPLPGTSRLAELLVHIPSPLHFVPWQPLKQELAAILFTSGSTGPAKGTVYTNENFYAQIDCLRNLYNIEPGEIDLCTFPLFALFAPALGMTAVVPDMDASKPGQVNPERIFEAFDDFAITNMFGSPALLRRVADYGCRQQRRIPSLKRIISAGAPVPADILRQLETMLAQETQIYTPYGATESLPVSSIGSHEILRHTAIKTDMGHGICVGHPVPGIEIRIIPISDEPIASWDGIEVLPPDAIGEICVRGTQVTSAYYRQDQATAYAKIYADDGSFFHRMGDVGYMDKHGRLWFCGRKNHRVQTPSATLYTIPCEAVFNLHPDVRRTALVGCGKRGTQQAVLCVELHEHMDACAWKILREDLCNIQRQYPHTSEISAFLQHPQFPVDVRHNAKIFREKLADWAQEKLEQEK